MEGKLYGVGVGPGEAELMTIKAKRILDQVPIIAVPVKSIGEDSTALNIIKEIIDIKEKEILEVEFSMDKNKEKREASRKNAINLIKDKLKEGKDIAMITLGDVSIYSTYMYINNSIKEAGYLTEIIPGITSFSAIAAKAQISLAEGNETLAIIPAVKDNTNLAEIFRSYDNVVMMKAAGSIKNINQCLEENFKDYSALVASKCGFEDEYIGKVDLERENSYFTTMIIKKGGTK
ncbi:precorrin-2 C(20)-methyltransferase [Clostridium cellulovorans]|uniref:Cobalt-precorrin-2 C(20)-methyltransferase n=1 Tax=Clostridium cellulovorans (strain ATCC 35296 / DSM 3052 / OCM 3 / 743B) TaxID=573061 RepID=D9SP03_CLOC7|nr:precorrin-2 C(20)-methyltransferase [Clostridium cellulovorans]ADL51968.1 precorrin-2 C20-methyltransferase [Clostridium cellulovorans 743B]